MERYHLNFISRVKNERLFVVSFAALALSSIWARRMPRYTFSDLKVLYTLFVLLVVVKGLEKSGFPQKVSLRLRRKRFTSHRLIIATSLMSMMVTNDVAVMAMVPITMVLFQDGVEWLVALEAVSANAASSMVPFGNPQNIFIYLHFHLRPLQFIRSIAPLTVAVMAFVFVVTSVLETTGVYSRKETANKKEEHVYQSTDAHLYLGFFVMFALSILKILPLWTGMLVVLYSIIFNRETLKIDYFLLGIFASFFGFTDNLTKLLRIPTLGRKGMFFTSMMTSQVISNVPSALLLAKFSSHMWKDLLWGVSVGGFGSLFGSLASLISYRLLRSSRPSSSRKFLVVFHALNILAMAVGVAAYLTFIH